jgi:hypothetical protein
MEFIDKRCYSLFGGVAPKLKLNPKDPNNDY